jgi:trans-aconitate 2-methyltransferase
MPAWEWDSRSYDRVSAPQQAWGRDVLQRLRLQGDETVLDAGCGSGQVTEMLLQLLPAGRVIAVDSSPSMVETAKQRLGPRADVCLLDLLDLDLEQPVDAVFSTATFHWIADHDRLFHRLHDALRPAGRLVAQCGGEGNVQRVHQVADQVASGGPFAAYLQGWQGPWNFSSPARAQAALRGCGFSDVRCWLVPAPVIPARPREFLRTVILGAHLQRLPPKLKEPFVTAVQERLGDPPTIDYVRLNIDAAA